MRRSPRRVSARRLLPRWVVTSLAPWTVAGCLLVSFTASAGPRTEWMESALRRSSVQSLETVARAVQPRLTLPIPADMADNSRADLSAWVVPPRLASASPEALRLPPRSLLFLDDADLLPATRLQGTSHPDLAMALPGGVFTADHSDGTSLSSTPGDVVPGASLGGASPSSLAILSAATPDGATPAIPRAVSLASTTPAPVEPQVVTLQAKAEPPKPDAQKLAVAPPPKVPLPPVRPVYTGYADLIEPEDMSREQRCLAEAVYFEARSEPPSGQAAVAQVVLNRVKSGLYPDSVCGVVYQNRHRYLGCQFSFACEGRSLRVTEPGPWKQAVKIARSVTFGQTYLPAVGNATHYHANYVKPHWSRVFKKTDIIGRHIFYKLRPGQT